MINGKVLTKHRTSLMGIAIICIILCHTSLYFPSEFEFVYSACKQFFQIGVDIFFLLSGVGCFYSLHKNGALFKFYWKRICRVLIPYLLIILAWGALQPLIEVYTSAYSFVYAYSLVTFFLRGALNSWYVAAILVLYMVAPFVYRVLSEKNVFPIVASSYILAVGVMVWAESSGGVIGHATKIVSEIFLNRIAVFIVGMWFGRSLCLGNGLHLSRKVIYFLLVIGTGLFSLNVIVFPGVKYVFSQWFVTHILFAPICISISLLLGEILEQNIEQKFNIVLKWLGCMTLEIYLLHEKILTVFDKWIVQNQPSDFWRSLASNLLAIIVTLFLAQLFHKLITAIQGKLQKNIALEGKFNE